MPQTSFFEEKNNERVPKAVRPNPWGEADKPPAYGPAENPP